MRANAKERPFVIRTGYEPVQRCGKVCEGEDLTKQSFKDECDINKMVARYQRAGILPPLPGGEPVYADVSAYDFQEFQLVVANAKQMFAALPAELRYRFGNDPAKMLEFIEDEKNREEAQKLGLLKPSKPQDAPKAPEGAAASSVGERAPKAAVEAAKTNSPT